jgi:hypothetical protein
MTFGLCRCWHPGGFFSSPRRAQFFLADCSGVTKQFLGVPGYFTRTYCRVFRSANHRNGNCIDFSRSFHAWSVHADSAEKWS